MLIKVDVPAQEVAYQIIAAVEGGSGYWCSGFQLLESVAKPLESPWYACPFFWGTEGYRIQVTYDNPGEGPEVASKVITESDVQEGLRIMAAKYGRHFGDMLADNSDAETGDALLQCIVFGEIIFG